MLMGDEPAFDRKYVSAVAGKMPEGVAVDYSLELSPRREESAARSMD